MSAGERPPHLRPVVTLGNEPLPPRRSSSSEPREPAIAARCERCEAPLFGTGELEAGRAPGERVCRCPSCGFGNVFYSAAWLSSDEGGRR